MCTCKLSVTFAVHCIADCSVNSYAYLCCCGPLHNCFTACKQINNFDPGFCCIQEEGFPETPGMSFYFRIKLFALCIGNILAMILLQKVSHLMLHASCTCCTFHVQYEWHRLAMGQFLEAVGRACMRLAGLSSLTSMLCM